MKRKYCVLCLLYAVVFATRLWAAGNSGGPSQAKFVDDPKAHAIYDRMIDALHRSKTLYVESAYHWGTKNYAPDPCSYRMWLKKPNYVRVEATGKDKRTGVLVGDGCDFWIYWTDGRRPRYDFDDDATYARNGRDVYMKESSPAGRHSIAHKFNNLCEGMMMSIMQPSMFLNCPDNLASTMDGVHGLGTERVSGEPCDLLEVSYMAHQRSKYYWVSKRDHMPRKLKEVVRVASEIVIQEDWSRVAVDKPVADSLFAWTPPAGWSEWRMPTAEERMKLKPGMAAPDFDLTAIDGTRIRLSDLRGKVVWLNVWRSG